jgi:acyl-coenzyme A thioesterase PaaI-like protein
MSSKIYDCIEMIGNRIIEEKEFLTEMGWGSAKNWTDIVAVAAGSYHTVGLKEDGSVVALFQFNALLQSYPERTHGGVITAMIDETIGRAIWTKDPNMWGVTMTIDVKFRKPVPYDVPLKCIGKLTRDTSMTFEGEAKIIDENKTVLAEGHAVYFKLSYEKITNHDHEHEEDKMFVVKDNVKEIEL